MPSVALNDTPFEGRSRSFTNADRRERVTCNGCGSILDARFEGRRSLTVLGVAYEVDVYRCGRGRGRQIRREAAAA